VAQGEQMASDPELRDVNHRMLFILIGFLVAIGLICLVAWPRQAPNAAAAPPSALLPAR
jgi:hypothetical protein